MPPTLPTPGDNPSGLTPAELLAVARVALAHADAAVALAVRAADRAVEALRVAAEEERADRAMMEFRDAAGAIDDGTAG